MAREILTADSELWPDFWDRLAELLEESGGCDNTHRWTRLALSEMPASIDVAESLDWFRRNGGFCDCEVLLNCGWAR